MMRNWLCFTINKIIILTILVFVERMMMQIVYDDSFRYNYYSSISDGYFIGSKRLDFFLNKSIFVQT